MKQYKIERFGLKIQIDETMLEKIRRISLKNLPNEFGGILLGTYRNDYKLAVVEKILLPKYYKSSPRSFQRTPKGLNEKIKDAFNNSKGRTIYLGEWHSHPNAKPIPSVTDRNAMKSIANSESVMTENPIFLIIGIGENYFDPKFYIIIKKEIHEYEQSEN